MTASAFLGHVRRRSFSAFVWTFVQKRSIRIIMPVDVGQWTGDLALHEVEEKPGEALTVKYGSLEIDELGKVLTPSQVSAAVHGYNANVTHVI